MKIIFWVKYDSDIPIGKNKITTDFSILFEPSISIDAFAIHPYHWSFELTTQEVREDQYLLRYAMGSLCLLDYCKAELVIPESQHGKVYVSFSSPPCADGIYYSKYSAFQEKKYYDAKNKIFAIGDINALHSKCVEFASGQFAVINDLGELVAIYVCVD
jgi:hypothetical protein